MKLEKSVVLNSFNEMLEFQDGLNKIVDPNWKDLKRNWRRAIWTETAELLNEFDWKWWKAFHKSKEKQTIHAMLEMVDIWHFLLSLAIDYDQNYDVDFSRAIWLFNTYETSFVVYDFRRGQYPIIEMVEDLARSCLNQNSGVFLDFFVLCHALNMDLEMLKSLYFGKGVLNRFRQDNGYKTGTYRREWKVSFSSNTMNDNEILAKIVQEFPTISEKDLYEKLNRYYNES